MARTPSSMRRARPRVASVRIVQLVVALAAVAASTVIGIQGSPQTRLALAIAAVTVAFLLAGAPSALEQAAKAAADEPRRTRPREWWETAGHGRISRPKRTI